MNVIDLKKQVAVSVSVRWDDFLHRHPNLAGVVDQDLLIDNVAAAISNDAEYAEALHAARQINAGLESLVAIVDRYVMKFISQLV